jgi:hypothetical protein
MSNRKNRKYSHFLGVQEGIQQSNYEALIKTDEFKKFQSNNQKSFIKEYGDNANFQILKDFLCTPEGEIQATRLRILPIENASVELVVPPKEKRHYPFIALEDGKFITIRIDLSRASKYEAMSFVGHMHDWYRPHTPPKRSTARRSKVNEWNVWLLYDEFKNFTRVAKEINSNSSTVRKAYLRAFEKVTGTPYDPNNHNLKKLAKKRYLPKNFCGDCKDRNECKAPCKRVLDYIDQDTCDIKLRGLTGKIDQIDIHTPPAK